MSKPICPHCKEEIKFLHTKVVSNVPPDHPDIAGHPVIVYFCANDDCGAVLSVGINY